MIEVTPTSELPALYREWAKEDPIFYKAAEYIENGCKRDQVSNENKKLKALLKDIDIEAFSKYQRSVSAERVKKVALYKTLTVADTTARSLIISAENFKNGKPAFYSYNSKNLRKLRVDAGLSQREVAELMECSLSHVRNMESGNVNCNSNHVKVLKSKLNKL